MLFFVMKQHVKSEYEKVFFVGFNVCCASLRLCFRRAGFGNKYACTE